MQRVSVVFRSEILDHRDVMDAESQRDGAPSIARRGPMCVVRAERCSALRGGVGGEFVWRKVDAFHPPALFPGERAKRSDALGKFGCVSCDLRRVCLDFPKGIRVSPNSEAAAGEARGNAAGARRSIPCDILSPQTKRRLKRRKRRVPGARPLVACSANSDFGFGWGIEIGPQNTRNNAE